MVGPRINAGGRIGDAALGLLCRLGTAPDLPDSARAALLTAYLYPDPPVAAFRAVRAHARAAMDVSDGLVGDLLKLCRTAGVGATLDVDCVPLSPAVAVAVRVEPALRDRALTGGDDYQVLATVAEDRLDAYRGALAEAGVTVAAIGRIVEGAGLAVTAGGRPVSLADGRFQHF
jgi:thiamine-monophosphate kinase